MALREQRTSFYTGLFLVTLSTLMLEMLNTRVLSVMSWYHLAFFVISLAMFGMTVGTVIIYSFPRFFAAAHLYLRLGQAAFAFGATAAVAHLIILTLPIASIDSWRNLATLAVLTICISLPFIFSGIAVILAVTRSPFPTGRVYACDLIGAAGGCLLAILLMHRIDAHSAVLITATLGMLGSRFFFLTAGNRRGQYIALALAFVVLIGAVVNAVSVPGLRPWTVKDKRENPQRILYERWNSYSRVTADKPIAVTLPAPYNRRFVIPMLIDGLAGTNMWQNDGDPVHSTFLLSLVQNTAFRLRDNTDVCVIGVGGGQDVLSALAGGADHVTGIELNPIFVEWHRDTLRFFSRLLDSPRVTLINDEARSHLAASQEQYDIIQMSLIDTWAATGAGAFTLSENGLYTLEAWKIFLDRLKPGGLFSVSRWYNPEMVDETTRSLSLAVGSLLQRNIAEPDKQIAVVSKDNIATLIVSPTPFAPETLSRLETLVQTNELKVLWLPGRPAASPLLERIVHARSLDRIEAISRPLFLNINPPTDDKPFFFNLLKFSALGQTSTYLAASGSTDKGVVNGNMVASLTLMTIFALTLLLTILTVLLPLMIQIDLKAWTFGQIARGSLYFACLGLGFMFCEIALLQRLSVFLGNPVYSLAFVLASLILFAGLGSMASERVRAAHCGKTVFALGLLLGALIISLRFLTPWLTVAFQTEPLGARLVIAACLVTPLALLMGMFFPLGLRAMSSLSDKPLPWFFGINGAAGVFASTAAIMISINLGINMTFLAAAICYCTAAVCGLRFPQDPEAER